MFFPDNPILDAATRGLLLSSIGLVWMVFLVRIVGLRSFSKMTNFDFVATVALGSLLAGASQATEWTSFWQAMAGMAGLMVAQFIAARIRTGSDRVEEVMQNEPVLLMKDGTFREDAMRDHRVTRSDVIAKLREANVLAMKDVRAVILETTGDVSVLHGSEIEEVLLDGVRT